MLAGLPSSEDEKNKEEDGMVTMIVTVDEELLRIIEASGYPDFSTDPTTKSEVDGEAPTKNKPG